MNSVAIVLTAFVILLVAYVLYGAWLAKQWGVDPARLTPAREFNDGADYVPTKYPLLFGHHFASIAGAGPITGPVQAAIFGWLPVLLWVLIGGIFFGGVQDFSALLVSVRNKGRSLGEVLGERLGKSYRLVFLVFGWISLVLVIASFTDIVAATFAGVDSYGVTSAESASIACASILFVLVSMVFGLCLYGRHINMAAASGIGVLLVAVSIALGMRFPLYLARPAWIGMICLYVFFASVLPVWILLQPRDYLNSLLLISLMIATFFGIIATNPAMALPPVTGLVVNGEPMFPVLFAMVACGAASGFHSLVSSGTTSKQLAGEGDARLIGFGGMLLECALSVLVLVAVGAFYTDADITLDTPTAVFAASVAGLLKKFGVSEMSARVAITLAVSAFALTTLDTAARVGRYLIQELFAGGGDEPEKLTGFKKFMANKQVSTAITVLLSGALALGGYRNTWMLYGVSNQMLATLALLIAAIWLGEKGKNNRMLLIPMAVMLLSSLAALALAAGRSIRSILVGSAAIGVESLRLLLLAVLFLLALYVAKKALLHVWQGIQKQNT